MKRLTTLAAIAIALFGSASFAQCWGGSCYSGQCYSGSCYRATARPIRSRIVGEYRPILANGAGTACRNGSCQFQSYQPSALVAIQASDAFDSACQCDDCQCDPCQCGESNDCACEGCETVETTEPVPACGSVATQTLATVCVNGTCARRPVASAVKTTVAASYIAAANAVRALRGLPPLQYDPSLDAGSFNHAVSMSHYGALYHASGVNEICAQNVGVGIDGALQQWVDSPLHAAVLFNPRYTRAGFANYRDRYGRNWCVARFL